MFCTGCEIRICDFHREQAWIRWTKLLKHGVNDKRNDVLELLRSIANASTVDKYDEAVNNLKTNILWNENKALQQWFTRTWLAQHEVHCLALTSIPFIVCYYPFFYKYPTIVSSYSDMNIPSIWW